jgi:putative SOS response-associated peptidase YedK
LPACSGTVNPLPNVAPTWNLAPSQDAPVVRRHPQTCERHLNVLRWGLLPHFTQDLNTLTGRSMRGPRWWRWGDIRHVPQCLRRSPLSGLVPASAFYEWKPVRGGPKQPYAIARGGRDANDLRRALGGLVRPRLPVWLGEV